MAEGSPGPGSAQGTPDDPAAVAAKMRAVAKKQKDKIAAQKDEIAGLRAQVGVMGRRWGRRGCEGVGQRVSRDAIKEAEGQIAAQQEEVTGLKTQVGSGWTAIGDKGGV